MRRISFPAGRAGRWVAALAAAGVVAAGMAAARSPGPPLESLWYLAGDGAEAFVRNAGAVTIVAPMAYEVDSAGTLRGRVDARVVRAARRAGVRVMPVVRQPEFDQAQLARLLRDPAGRARAAASLARACRDGGYWGIQVDFENVRVQDGPLLTAFYRQIAGALRGAGCRAAIAVVPRVSDAPGESAYQYWMFGHWRGAYDYGALAAAGDFIVLMSYDQHTRHTPPGPVAALPWVRATLDFALADGAPPEKILLGVPAYSRHWRAAYTGGGTADAGSAGLGYGAAAALAKRNGARLQWDADHKVYHARYDRETALEYLYVENARTFGHKLDLVRERGLRGFAVWRLGQEDPEVWDRVRRLPLRRE
jgi:spore germination protein YaaH